MARMINTTKKGSHSTMGINEGNIMKCFHIIVSLNGDRNVYILLGEKSVNDYQVDLQ